MKLNKPIISLLILILIQGVFAFPIIDYISPTPANATYTSNNFTIVNISVSNLTDASLSNFSLNWNGTNYSFYDDNLVLAMNFNNNSAIGENSTHAVDISKYGNNGTLVNGTAWNSSGKFGNALRFDGVNDYVVTGSKVWGFSNIEYTGSFWIKTNRNSINPVIALSEPGTYNNEFLIWINWEAVGKVSVLSHKSASNYKSLRSTTSVNDGYWHYIVGMIDGSQDNLRIFVDGIEEFGVSSTVGTPTDLSDVTRTLGIGTRIPASYFNGLIDEVRIYNRALSAEEVTLHYQSELSKYNSTQYTFYDNVSNLLDGTYTYYGWANDTLGQQTSSTQQTITIDTTKPAIDYISPTDTNGTAVSRNYTTVNVSITEPNLAYFAFNWNGVNYTYTTVGVQWNESADTYTRTTTVGSYTQPDFNNIYPWSQMRRVTLWDNGTVNYYLNATNSSLKEDGTLSDLSGADGQVMVQIPKFYKNYSYDATNSTISWQVSAFNLSGFSVDPAFIKNGVEVNYRYIGAYEGTLYDVSASIYTDGIYQTAVSCVFANADSSLTIASRSGVFSKLTVGDKLVVSGTTNNNGVKTIASLVSATKITISEAVVDETAAATVVQTEKDWTATTGDKLSSVSGKAPINYGTRANFRAAALNRGAGWRQQDYDLISAIQLLYLTEYASFYSQSKIGAGITNVADWAAYNDYNPIAFTGNSNSIGNATGNTAGSASALTESTKYLSYRGIENWYGHLWKFVDGININNNIPYVTNNQSVFADDTATGYTALGVTLINANGWQNTLQKIDRGFLPLTVGVASTTKLTDYYYQAAGWRVVTLGGAANNGAAAGAVCFHADDDSGVASRAYSVRLAY